VLTNELMKLSTPPVERTVRNSLTKSVAAFLDDQFLDPAITEIAGSRPAAITFGALSQTSSGSSAAQINSDLQAMTAALESWEEPRWIMRPQTASFIVGADATLFAGLKATPDGGLLHGIPVLNSTNAPATITLLDVADILLADDGGVDINVSREANVVLDDGGSPSETTMVSLYDKNYVGIRVEREIDYKRGHDSSVVYMTVNF